MKKIFSYILIAAFVLAPVVVHAATAPASTGTAVVVNPFIANQPLVPQEKAVQQSLQSTLDKLNDLAGQTQLALGQISADGIDTTSAQGDLIAASADLDNANTSITDLSTITIPTRISGTTTLDSLNTTAIATENSLADAKTHLLNSLTILKTLLPDISSASQ